MEGVFLRVINMSITASYVIAVVLAVRWLLARCGAPKKFAYMLWVAAGFRLCCPVSFEAAWSLFSAGPLKAPVTMTGSLGGGPQRIVLDFVPKDIGMMGQPAVETGVLVLNEAINGSLPAAVSESSVNPMQIWLAVGTAVWVIGIAALLVYSVVSYVRLRHRLSHAVLHENNVWLSEFVESPFIMGFIKPRIYIPYGLDMQTLEYVLIHENCHLKRGDHLVKSLAFLILVLHWFNPFCWLAFGLMSKDMEMSCDEKVLLQVTGKTGSDADIRGYSMSLLNFAVGRRFSLTGPLAFGETSVRTRIKNILDWKRPRIWVTAIALIVCIAAGAVCLANPMSGKRTVARVMGEDVSAEWMEYQTRMAQEEGSENPAEEALESIKAGIRNEKVVREYSKLSEEYFEKLIDDYVSEQLSKQENPSAEAEQAFLERTGMTMKYWQENILPEYEAPFRIYREYLISSSLTELITGNEELQNPEFEILDPAFMALMAEKYPCRRDLSREFVDNLVPEFEAQYGTTGTEIYSWYRYDYGRRAIVYGRTFYGGREYEGEAYISMTGGRWTIDELKEFRGIGSPDTITGNLYLLSGGDETAGESYLADYFSLFPEFHNANMGRISIMDEETNRTIYVDMTISRFTNTGAMEGPRINFAVDLTDWENPQISLKRMLDDNVYYGEDEKLKKYSRSYYVIPDERIIQMAKTLYEYVPAHATVQ